MVTVGGQIHPYTGDAGPAQNISGKVWLEIQNFKFVGTLSTTAKASFASGQFIEIQLSGGSKGYVEYLVSA